MNRLRGPLTILTGLALFAVAGTAQGSQAPVQIEVTATRLSDQPLLVPSADEHGVFNPAAAKVGGRTILLTRDQDKAGTSSIGYAESMDGIHFTRAAKPVLAGGSGRMNCMAASKIRGSSRLVGSGISPIPVTTARMHSSVLRPRTT